MAHLCLKWNNFDQSITQCLYEEYEREEGLDVTLACEGQQLNAHKCVLRSCSPYFKALLLANPCRHPIIILKDVRFQDLKSLVEFMYRGEVTVSHDNLPSLLKTAECLQVKQLAEMHSPSRPNENQQLGRLNRKRKKPINRAGRPAKIEQSGESADETSTAPKALTMGEDDQRQLAIESGQGDGEEQVITEGNADGTGITLENLVAEAVGQPEHGTEIAMVEPVDEHGQSNEIGTFENEEYLNSSQFNAESDSQVLVFRKKQSFVWEYFSETGKGSVKCRSCKKLLSYKDTSGSTSNMIKHLKTVHHVERAPGPPLQE